MCVCVCDLVVLTCGVETELVTYDGSIAGVPVIITDGAPGIVETDLYSPRVVPIASHQPHITVLTHLGLVSCEGGDGNTTLATLSL